MTRLSTTRTGRCLRLPPINAGPTGLRRFRDKAQAMGLDRNVWFGNVENGAAAIVGRETVQYVSNVYKYYIAYKLVIREMDATEAAKTVIK